MKTEAKHTPGPWEVSRRNAWRVADAHDNTVASTGTDSSISYGAHVANARLIAAAPDMLEALKACLAALQAYTGFSTGVEQGMAEEAIAKATGEIK